MRTATSAYPECGHCHRRFAPSATWNGINLCRLYYLLPLIEKTPGITTAKLAQDTDMPYGSVLKGMARAREADLFRLEAEERDAGGVRYRYFLPDDYDERKREMLISLQDITGKPL